MKKSTKIVLLLLPVLFQLGCSQFIYHDQGREYRPGTAKSFPLDGTLYVRTVGADNYARSKGHELNLLSTNAPGKKVDSAKANSLYKQIPVSYEKKGTKVIEIEYLFFSKNRDRVLYISTVADRYKDRYSDPARFLGVDNPNVADFRLFLFGERNPANRSQYIFYYRDKKHMDTWTTAIDAGNLELTMIEKKRLDALEDVFLLRDALANPMNFEKQSHFRIWYLAKDEKDKSKAEPLLTPFVQVIENEGEYKLLFPFAHHQITFPYSQVIYAIRSLP
jgi:hypothetical protein